MQTERKEEDWSLQPSALQQTAIRMECEIFIKGIMQDVLFILKLDVLSIAIFCRGLHSEVSKLTPYVPDVIPDAT